MHGYNSSTYMNIMICIHGYNSYTYTRNGYSKYLPRRNTPRHAAVVVVSRLAKGELRRVVGLPGLPHLARVSKALLQASLLVLKALLLLLGHFVLLLGLFISLPMLLLGRFVRARSLLLGLVLSLLSLSLGLFYERAMPAGPH
jgi:hypothetical protein